MQLEKNLSTGGQPSIAHITSSMGKVYQKMGDYESALEQFQDAVGLYKKLTDKHGITTTCYHNLAATYL